MFSYVVALKRLGNVRFQCLLFLNLLLVKTLNAINLKYSICFKIVKSQKYMI